MKCHPQVLIVGIAHLAVSPTPQPPDEATAALSLRFADGEVIHFGMTQTALAEFCSALIESSPRAPGTPGRN